ncbi:hypothetical protein ACJX0J_040071, partial [Zea mays]
KSRYAFFLCGFIYSGIEHVAACGQATIGHVDSFVEITTAVAWMQAVSVMWATNAICLVSGFSTSTLILLTSTPSVLNCKTEALMLLPFLTKETNVLWTRIAYNIAFKDGG